MSFSFHQHNSSRLAYAIYFMSVIIQFFKINVVDDIDVDSINQNGTCLLFLRSTYLSLSRLDSNMSLQLSRP